MKKEWAWHYLMSCHALLKEKSPHSLKLVCKLPDERHSNFHCRFQKPCFRAFFDIHNVFLGQVAEKWQLVKVQMAQIYLINRHFGLWRAAISESLDIEKRYILQTRGPNHINWLKFWNWNVLYTERHKVSFVENGTFAFTRALLSFWNCHAPFHD